MLTYIHELVCEGTALTTSISQKKSIKLPNGKYFSSGNNLKFASQLINIENKSEINANYYLTVLAYMQYIKSMYKEAVVEHLIPYLQKDSLEYYHNADDIIKYLKIIYYDANSVTKAKCKLR